MKLISWNVNGLRACLSKGGFEASFAAMAPDILCLQETKLSAGQLDLSTPGMHQYWNYAEKKGYSGTAVFTRKRPLSARLGLGIEEHDREGRVITLEFPDFYLVNVYTPNAQDGLKRIDYRMAWEDAFRDHLRRLDAIKPVLVCGDMNVAHNEIDLARPDANHGNAGFSDQEREKFGTLLAAGFSDTFRTLYPDRRDAYSWWSYRMQARRRNVGWRIDYFVASERFMPRVEDAFILTEIEGSDHCPVGLVLRPEEV
ncbi:MAG TPA: exodeoxyribonuclease III [Clostridia bacterium]|nr:exodeoxyribonuclease III [Clostridia bacterium]